MLLRASARFLDHELIVYALDAFSTAGDVGSQRALLIILDFTFERDHAVDYIYIRSRDAFSQQLGLDLGQNRRVISRLAGLLADVSRAQRVGVDGDGVDDLRHA